MSEVLSHTNPDGTEQMNLAAAVGAGETNGDPYTPAAENGAAREEDEDERKLFVGGLNHGTVEDTLRQHFSPYGEIAKVDLKYDPDTKKSRGFGFVTFKTSQSLNKALATSTHNINGKSVEPKKALAKPKPPPMKKVFVGGISPDVTEETIREHFGPHGRIEKIELPMDKEANKRRSFCFIVYETESAAKAAVVRSKQLIGKMKKECDVKLATPPPPKDGAPAGGRFGVPAGGRFNQGGPGAGRGRGRGGFQGPPPPPSGWGNQPYGYNYGYSQGYQGGYGGYDYSGYGGGYGSGFGNGYEGNYNWNYGQQNSGYGKMKRGAGAGPQGYHPYSQ